MLDATLSEAHLAVQRNFRAGYYFRAFEDARAALLDYPDDVGLKHMAVLCLVRGKAFAAAEALFDKFNLAQDKNEDILALSGKLAKSKIEDRGAAAAPKDYSAAAELYAAAYRQTGGSYSGVNAASLWYMAGQKPKAQALAADILKAVSPDNASAQMQYYFHATRGECLFILGDMEAAEAALGRALAVDPHNYAARTSTVKQFTMLGGGTLPRCALPLKVPHCSHYTGHLFHVGERRTERSLTEAETEMLAGDIKTLIAQTPISAGFGALAAGADILFAEAILDCGADLHLVLPVPVADFRRLSVTPMGAFWERRFDAALAKATSLRIILDDPGDFDALDLKMGSLIAMGLAALTADSLAADAVQFSVMDKDSADVSMAGTRQDIQLWHDVARETKNIAWPHPRQEKPRVTLSNTDGRQFKAMLFTDLKGYGKLPDRALPDIVSHIFEPMAAKCRALDVPPLQMKSWGDGLFLVFDDAMAAAEAAFALMECFDSCIEAFSALHGADVALRVGVHFGPVWERSDPFTDMANLYGRHVTIAARLEALAVPGTICVSENFAAVLAMTPEAHSANIICDYVGQATSEKEETIFSLYSLRKRRV